MVRVQTPFWGGVGFPNFETHPNCFFPKNAIDAWILICLLWVWPPETGTTRIVSTFLDSRIPINYTFPLANWQGGAMLNVSQCVTTRFDAPEVQAWLCQATCHSGRGVSGSSKYLTENHGRLGEFV